VQPIALVNEPKPGKVFGTAGHVIPPSWMFLGGQYKLGLLPSINVVVWAVNDPGYPYLLTLTFYKVLSAVAASVRPHNL